MKLYKLSLRVSRYAYTVLYEGEIVINSDDPMVTRHESRKTFIMLAQHFKQNGGQFMAATLPMVDHAVTYAKAGLPVIPLHHVLGDGSCSCGRVNCSYPGKHPRTKNGLKDATRDPIRIKRWWEWWPNASIGGVCGDSGWFCLDIDPRHDGFGSLARLIESEAPLPDTAVAMTGEYNGERGRHYWFRIPDDYGDLPATRINLREGIDVRCAGGYAVLPPSPHASGVHYEWEAGTHLHDATTAPAWLLHLVPTHIEGDSHWTPNPAFRMSKDVKQFLSGELVVEPGGQRDFLLQAARSVLTTGASVEETARRLWEGYNGDGGIANCEWDSANPWTPEQVYELVSNIYEKPPTSPLEKDFTSSDYTLDDAGNAERLVASFQPGHLIYTPQDKRWYVWDQDKGHFQPDNGDYLTMRWIDVAAKIAQQAQEAHDESTQKMLWSWSKNSRMKPRIDAAVSLAAKKVATSLTRLNTDPWLFGVANGVIDLRDGQLYEEEPIDLITQRSPVEFHEGARSRLLESFLKRVVPDEELRDFLQLAVGYSLTGDISEHAFFYVYGLPASGKSTLLETLRHIVGTYGTKAENTTFMRYGTRASNSSSEDLARLAGKRFVYTTEVEKGDRLAVGLVSQMVAGDSMSARFLYSPFFEFSPKFKLWFAANELPKTSGSMRSGLWRRVKVIPFNEVIPASERDQMLPRKLREPEQTSALLSWAVEGAVKWYDRMSSGDPEGGLPIPPAVARETDSFEHESDHVHQFVSDVIVKTGRTKDRVSTADMFGAYAKWCEREGRDQRRTRHSLTRTLNKDLGFMKKPGRVNGKVQEAFFGIQLKPEYEGPTAGITVIGPTGRRRKAE